MSTDGAPLVEIADLTVRIDGTTLLERVSIAVAPRTIHAIVGPNGGGKSTLLGALLGQVPFEGKIRLHFRDAGRIGVVPQTFSVDRTLPLTVAEFLLLARQRRPICFGYSAASSTVAALLKRVGLEGMERRRLCVLSGGELRRVLLANAIDPAPELLLLDEPASGVDAASVERLDDTLRELRAAGTTVLIVSHDVAEVRRVADVVTHLDRSVVRSGPVDEVLAAALPTLVAASHQSA